MIIPTKHDSLQFFQVIRWTPQIPAIKTTVLHRYTRDNMSMFCSGVITSLDKGKKIALDKWIFFSLRRYINHTRSHDRFISFLMQHIHQVEYWKSLKLHFKTPYSWEIIVHGLIEATRDGQTNICKSRHFLGKAAKHPCLPEIQIEMIYKCMSALEPAAYLQDMSRSSPRGWVDQQGWGTECQAALPCDCDHCQTTGMPCPVQELRQLLGQDRAAGLHHRSWR